MEEVFGEIMGLGYGSDSIMLTLLRSAMDEAHENVQSKDGPIELLNARSKFYEMAMILVEGCSRLIEEKAQIPEINREKMLLDLKESKDMVRGRLEDLKFSIIDRDIELVERDENEFRLRQTLEFKEKELISLRAKLALERTKSEELSNYQASGEREKNGDFCELKNSVDQQMLNIKQKLEDERMSLSSATDLFGDENIEEGPIRPEQNLVIEQMSSDIDCLKGTIDLAFGKMKNSEIGPSEKQWRWEIETNTIFICVNGFIDQIREIFEGNFDRTRDNETPLCFSSEQLDEFINEIMSLRYLLDGFINGENESQESCEPLKIIGRTSSEPLPESDQDSENSTYVAKMKKYHESIIKKQHEELNWMKIRDIFRVKENFSGKRNKDPDNLGGRIKEVVVKLDNCVKWNDKFRDQKLFREKLEMIEKEKIGSEIRKLRQERDDLNMQIMLIEDTNVTFLKGLIKDFHDEFQSYEFESLINDDVRICFFREMEDELKMLFQGKGLDATIESTLKEDVNMILLINIFKEIEMEVDCHNFENSIREEIYNFVVLEAAKSEIKLVTETETRDQSPSKKSILEEGNLNQELDFQVKCDENHEEISPRDNLSLRNHDNKQLLNQIKCSITIPLEGFQSMISELELAVNQKLEISFLRIEELTVKLQNLFPTISSLSKEAILYKKAFEIRCHNLRLAETEVDLLGDQVDELVVLLEKIFWILNQDSTVSTCDLRLLDIQNLIKEKLGRPRQVDSVYS